MDSIICYFMSLAVILSSLGASKEGLTNVADSWEKQETQQELHSSCEQSRLVISWIEHFYRHRDQILSRQFLIECLVYSLDNILIASDYDYHRF